MNERSFKVKSSIIARAGEVPDRVNLFLRAAAMEGVSLAGLRGEIPKRCFRFVAGAAAAALGLPGGRVELPTKGL